jgi:predicted transcriptional regulator
MKTSRWSEFKNGKLSPEAIARSDQRVAEALAELDLRALREAAGMTQVDLAETSGIAQSEVSRLEHSNDCMLSTLQRYVEGLGGTLEITATVKGRKIRLAG